MYARVTRNQADPARADALVEQLKAQMVPVFKQQPGYLGVIAIANRKTGEGAATTYWDSMEHLRASEAAIFAARDRFASEQGATILSFHRCEDVVSERKAAPEAGTHLRVATLRGVDESNAGALIARHRALISPFVLQQPGARASVLMLDRENGLAFAVSSYDTAANRDRGAEAVDEFIRSHPSDLRLEREVSTGETTFVELAVPVHGH